jgi:hypothetical protein
MPPIEVVLPPGRWIRSFISLCSPHHPTVFGSKTPADAACAEIKTEEVAMQMLRSHG